MNLVCALYSNHPYTAITCSGLSDPTNGMVTFTLDTVSPFDYQTTATYSCNIGFGLTSGDSVRMCLGSSEGPGEWSGTAPFCEGIHVILSLNLLYN